MSTSLKIFTDGGARGNPGPAASAFVAYDEDKQIFEGSKFLGTATNNEAEYNAVVLAYEWLVKKEDLHTLKNVFFFLDSELVVNQLKGIYKIKKDTLQKLSIAVRNMEEKVGREKISYTHVKREKNKIADKLVNISLDQNSRM